MLKEPGNLLTDTLFDLEKRQKSNVTGRGKDQLDPTKIE